MEDAEPDPTPPNSLAAFIVDELHGAGIVRTEDIQRAIDITERELTIREATGGIRFLDGTGRVIDLRPVR